VRFSTTRNASEKVLVAEENEVTINDGYWVPGVGPTPDPATWTCQWDWLSVRHDNTVKENSEKAPVSVTLLQWKEAGRKGNVVFADGHSDYVPRSYAHHPHHVLPRF
jgi:prepilin-type processing-associated H-X9-DG protein